MAQEYISVTHRQDSGGSSVAAYWKQDCLPYSISLLFSLSFALLTSLSHYSRVEHIRDVSLFFVGLSSLPSYSPAVSHGLGFSPVTLIMTKLNVSQSHSEKSTN